MTKPTLDELLRASAPRNVNDEPGMSDRVDAIVARSGRPKRRRAWIVVPVVGFSVLGLTAGALAVDNMLTLDVEIPVNYTTDTGTVVECDVSVGGGTLLDPKGAEIADWYRDQDWTGLGQRVYDRALEIDPSEGLESDHELSQDELDQEALNTALTELVSYTVPAEVLGSEASVAWQHDCAWILH